MESKNEITLDIAYDTYTKLEKQVEAFLKKELIMANEKYYIVPNIK